MSTDDQIAGSPWTSVWVSPRQTIARLVEEPPRATVWWLAALGAIAALYEQVALVGAGGLFGDWRYLLALLLLGAIGGIVWIYLYAIILSWIGGWFRGQASAAQIRLVIGWSMLPIIVSGVAVLLLGIALEKNTAASVAAAVVPFLSLYSLVMFVSMLGRIAHFGIWRAIATYLVAAVFVALGIALFVRSFVYQPFNVPSASMRPTLLVGDYFFASKFAYGYSHFSLPFSPPLFSGRILSSPPIAGDVVVFRHPRDTDTDYVKRVVGLPGDRIQMKQGQLYINDAAVKRERLADAVADGACGTSVATAKRWRETLPNGVSFETLDCLDIGQLDDTPVFNVPEGRFFALGDNRDNSNDSRALQFGPVPFENLIGRVWLIYYSSADGADGTPARLRTERIGSTVR